MKPFIGPHVELFDSALWGGDDDFGHQPMCPIKAGAQAARGLGTWPVPLQSRQVTLSYRQVVPLLTVPGTVPIPLQVRHVTG